ncbi:MAG: hypothetical protein HKM05_04160 [Spirochaetales bacterium]|nr:hypothetical protein [Spirochaetales bacterium]
MKTFFLNALFLLLMLAPTSLWADWPDRVFEISVFNEARLSNNYFPVTAFFNNPLVIDLNNMAQALTADGLVISASASNRIEINLAPTPQVKAGLFWGSEIYGFTTVPDALIALLANGTGSSGSTSTGSWNPQNFKGDVFADMGAWAGFHWGKWRLTVRPAYYIPLLHIDDINASYTVSTSALTGTTATTQASIPIYSVIPLPNSSTVGTYSPMSSVQLGQILGTGGIDLSADLQYELFPWLTLGGRLVNFPIQPARLDQGSILQATETLTTVDPSTNSGSPFKTTSTSSWTQALGTISLIRPFEARAVVSLYPFSDPWLAFTPSLGVGVWNGIYLNGGLKLLIDGRHWAHLSFNSDYQYGLWSQTVGMGFNVRLFEVDLAVGGTSTDFVQSFTDGVIAAVDVKLGF